MGKLRVYCLKTLKKLSIYPLGNTPSAPSVKSYWSWPVANCKESILTYTVVSPNTNEVHVPWHLYACLVRTEVPD